MNLNPSLFLLLSKYFLIFIISSITGWSFLGKNPTESKTQRLFLYTITGSSVLLVSFILASVIGLPAIYGLAVPCLSLVGRIIFEIKNKDSEGFISFQKKEILLTILFIVVAGMNYLGPMIVKNTSGFYSRGGGDHSSYLSLSEYFLERSIWHKVEPKEILPTHTNWMSHSFVYNSKDFSEVGPVANQFIASPFMALLPGSNEETFTAANSYYVFLASFSYLFLLAILINESFTSFFIFPAILFLNSVTVYISNCQSIPFLYGIAVMNTLLGLLILSVRGDDWKLGKLFLIQTILGSALLLIYPHLYTLGLALSAMLFVFFKKSPFQKNIVRYLFLFLLNTFIVTNHYLLISLHLIFLSPTMVGGSLSDYTWKNILSIWSGIVDFGFFMKGGLDTSETFVKVALYTLPSLVVLSIIPFLFKKGRQAFYLLFLVFFFLAFTLLYNYKGLSYQAVRFTELGQPYLICLVILCFYFLYQSDKKILKLISVILFLFYFSLEFKTRKYVVNEIVSRNGNQSEFRDAKDIILAKRIEKIQNTEKPTPILYYFGNGYGVETAGMSILLRNISSIFARGFTYGIVQEVQEKTGREHKPFDFLDKEFLDNSLHLVLKEPDIIQDLRYKELKNSEESDEFLFYKVSENPNVTQLIGEGWNANLSYGHEKYKIFRYLKAGKNAVVIWSDAEKEIKLTMTVHSDAENTRLAIHKNNESSNILHKIRKWDNLFKAEDTLQIQTKIKKGANVLSIEPSSGDESKPSRPWLYIWNITVENAQ